MRILLVDDHEIFREGLLSLLRTHPDVEVIGRASTVSQAIEMALELDPEVVLMDFGLPDGTGLDATRAILAVKPHIQIVFLTVYDEIERVYAALRSGASGYLLKNLPAAKLVTSLMAMKNGEAPISRRMTTSIVQEFNRLGPPHDPDDTALSRLTLREIEILENLAEGFGNQMIAVHLSLSETTVKNHVHSILHKLGLRNRKEAARFAQQHGLRSVHPAP